LNQIPGPVLAVAHSYGGAVITNAASMASNVVGLVYVAAYAPEEGERISDVARTSKDSVLGTALVQSHYPTGPDGASAVELTVDPAKFHDVFAGDLPVGQAAVMAAGQRAFAELSLTEPTGKPAWKNLPSWAVVATGDRVIGTDLVRSMAERAKATITKVDASHVVMISQPQAVTDVIMGAITAVAAADRAGAVA
jgi:pimeloyl-ACP methyl ester carboxylesterase